MSGGAQGGDMAFKIEAESMTKTTEAAKAAAEITSLLRAAMTGDVSLGARLKFVYPEAGVVMVDGSKTPNEVHNRDDEADCTVLIDPVLHLQMLRMEADQAQAFRQGKMRISGDVAVAVRLGPLVLRTINQGRS
ncbi:MAG: SCP2 sterol-binding domain-containing protein [Parvibaculum sp.]|uniref:SCP2 sterol-binding domain-containing protein n=1 Tax=Parvibaculum sp. TaxID=2024848 RepID=UPI0025D548ED|nr:SCP2 sterol-binding domain-containing protein [Parvibaculum sp.]MCE9649164.1 SCP2 sterol-binding domain-containing protein [Parvibaculum sp.]